MTTGKKKTVKAWAIILPKGVIENADTFVDDENCACWTGTCALGVYPTKKDAERSWYWSNSLSRNEYKIIPCTITYEIEPHH